MQGNRIRRAALSDEHRDLGATLRALRQEQQITQEDLGDRSGLHRNYVGAIERGEINPTFGTLLRLQGGLRTTLTWIAERYEGRRETSA